MILGESTHLSRAQFERLADVWQLAEQLRLRVFLVCDAETLEPGACRSWHEFDDSTLARFCSKILDRQVVVTNRAIDTNALVPKRESAR